MSYMAKEEMRINENKENNVITIRGNFDKCKKTI